MPLRCGGHAENSVTSRWFPSRYVSPWLLTVPVLIGVVLLPGCNEDTYSESMSYPVRIDPIVRDLDKTKEFNDPVPPGVLPLTVFNDIYKSGPYNPYYEDRDKIWKNEKLRDPFCLSDQDKAEIKKSLDEAFGKPAQPTVKVEGVPAATLQALQLDEKTLELGSRYYRLHCLHCHGLTGDGRGPSGKWLNPHPRDYRQGLFKFQSTDQTIVVDNSNVRKPAREDLYRTIHEGIEGTSMPAHNLLSEKDKNALVSYVMHLSIRGQTEYLTLANPNGFKYDSGPDVLYWSNKQNSIKKYMTDRAREVIQEWLSSQTMRIHPGAYHTTDADMKKSVLAGQKLFLGSKAACVSCHKDYGRQSVYKWDDWGTVTAKPRDFTKGIFRGGRRPIDIYHRIHSGINGVGMQPFGATLTSDEIWHLVNFVRNLSYPAMRKSYGIQID